MHDTRIYYMIYKELQAVVHDLPCSVVPNYAKPSMASQNDANSWVDGFNGWIGYVTYACSLFTIGPINFEKTCYAPSCMIEKDTDGNINDRILFVPELLKPF